MVTRVCGVLTPTSQPKLCPFPPPLQTPHRPLGGGSWASKRRVARAPPWPHPSRPCLAGQEADQGSLRRAGAPPELLQVHGPGVQGDVPAVLHQTAALQSVAVPAALQVARVPPPCLGMRRPGMRPVMRRPAVRHPAVRCADASRGRLPPSTQLRPRHPPPLPWETPWRPPFWKGRLRLPWRAGPHPPAGTSAPRSPAIPALGAHCSGQPPLPLPPPVPFLDTRVPRPGPALVDATRSGALCHRAGASWQRARLETARVSGRTPQEGEERGRHHLPEDKAGLGREGVQGRLDGFDKLVARPAGTPTPAGSPGHKPETPLPCGRGPRLP